jgi:hypothetical protein
VPFVVVALALILLTILAAIVLLPITLVQRYRVGTARRPARRWVATLNAALIAMSCVFFLIAAAITNVWVPRALAYSAAGMAAGTLLAVVGLLLTKWEHTPRGRYYTPNRWLVLAITLTVTARLLYGFWRGWHAWQATPSDMSWLAAAGAAGSLAAGALVLGYYFAYWVGVRARA